MQPGDASECGFRIWAVDNVVYGPVELPTLVGWVQEERVTAETWVFSDRDSQWKKASSISELRMFFESRDSAATIPLEPEKAALKPGWLRRVKIFADMRDAQLERFVEFMEVQPVTQWTDVVKQGELGDSMYLVLEGELRVRMMIGGKETTLVTLRVGEFFGEISLFDQGPRSADVIANEPSVLLKISAKGFENLLSKAPDLAAPFLFAIAKTLTARIRADNKRYRDSVAFSRTGRQ